MAIAELLLGIILYYLGYCYYCSGQWGYTMILVILCSICIYVFWQRVHHGKYRHMNFRKIDKLSGKAFEEYLAVQFRRLGYRVRHTDESHDYGADLILKKRGKCIVVQAKRYDRNIGISAVQEAVGAVAYYEADQAMVVTNQRFTKSAINLARQNEVDLWDRDRIRRMFRIYEA